MEALRLWLLLPIAACMATACAAREARPPQSGRSAASSPCVGSGRGEGRGGVTWAEYYSEIRERAARHGALVIWVNPPAVQEVALRDTRSACR